MNDNERYESNNIGSVGNYYKYDTIKKERDKYKDEKSIYKNNIKSVDSLNDTVDVNNDNIDKLNTSLEQYSDSIGSTTNRMSDGMSILSDAISITESTNKIFIDKLSYLTSGIVDASASIGKSLAMPALETGAKYSAKLAKFGLWDVPTAPVKYPYKAMKYGYDKYSDLKHEGLENTIGETDFGSSLKKGLGTALALSTGGLVSGSLASTLFEKINPLGKSDDNGDTGEPGVLSRLYDRGKSGLGTVGNKLASTGGSLKDWYSNRPMKSGAMTPYRTSSFNGEDIDENVKDDGMFGGIFKPKRKLSEEHKRKISLGLNKYHSNVEENITNQSTPIYNNTGSIKRVGSIFSDSDIDTDINKDNKQSINKGTIESVYTDSDINTDINKDQKRNINKGMADYYTDLQETEKRKLGKKKIAEKRFREGRILTEHDKTIIAQPVHLVSISEKLLEKLSNLDSINNKNISSVASSESIFSTGLIKGIVMYAIPAFGSQYKSDLPSVSKVGVFGAMMQTLGLIYIANRHASDESNKLLIQVIDNIKQGFGIDTKTIGPGSRSVKEWIGGIFKEGIDSKGPGPLDFMKDKIETSLRNTTEKIVNFAAKQLEDKSKPIPEKSGFTQWRLDKLKEKEVNTQQSTFKVLPNVLNDIKYVLTKGFNRLSELLVLSYRKNTIDLQPADIVPFPGRDVEYLDIDGTKIPKLRSGATEVKQDGIVEVHKGEQIVPIEEINKKRALNNQSIIEAQMGEDKVQTDNAPEKKGFFGGMFGSIMNFFTGGFFKNIGKSLVSIKDTLVNKLTSIYNSIISLPSNFKELLSDTWNNIKSIKDKIFAITDEGGILEPLGDLVRSYKEQKLGLENEPITESRKKISAISFIFDGIRSYIEKQIDTISNSITNFFNKDLGEFRTTMTDNISGLYQKLIPNSIKEFLQGMYTDIKPDILEYTTGFTKAFIHFKNFKNEITDFTTKVLTPITNAWTNTSNVSIFDKFIASLKSIRISLEVAKNNIVDFIVDAGKSLGYGIANVGYSGFQMWDMVTDIVIYLDKRFTEFRIKVGEKLLPESLNKVYSNIEKLLLSYRVSFFNVFTRGIEGFQLATEKINEEIQDQEMGSIKRYSKLGIAGIKGAATHAGSVYVNLVTDFIDTLVGIKDLFKGYFTTYKVEVDGMIKEEKSEGIIGGFKSAFLNLWFDLKTITSNIRSSFSTFHDNLKEFIGYSTGLKDSGYNLTNLIIYPFTVLANAIDKVKTSFLALANSMWEGTKNLFKPRVEPTLMATGGIINNNKPYMAAAGVVTRPIIAGEAGAEAIIPLTDPNSSILMINWLTETFKKVGIIQGDSIKEIGIISKLDEIKDVLIKGLIDENGGILSTIFSGIKNVGIGVTGSIVSLGKGLFKGLFKPISILTAVGKAIVKLPIKGMSYGWEKLKKPLDKLVTLVSTGISNIISSLNYVAERIGSVIKSALEATWKVITLPFRLMKKLFKTPFELYDKAKSAVKGVITKIKDKILGDEIVAVGPDGAPVKARWPKRIIKGLSLITKNIIKSNELSLTKFDIIIKELQSIRVLLSSNNSDIIPAEIIPYPGEKTEYTDIDGTDIPKLKSGAIEVIKDGLAEIHKGERIIPVGKNDIVDTNRIVMELQYIRESLGTNNKLMVSGVELQTNHLDIADRMKTGIYGMSKKLGGAFEKYIIPLLTSVGGLLVSLPLKLGGMLGKLLGLTGAGGLVGKAIGATGIGGIIGKVIGKKNKSGNINIPDIDIDIDGKPKNKTGNINIPDVDIDGKPKNKTGNINTPDLDIHGKPAKKKWSLGKKLGLLGGAGIAGYGISSLLSGDGLLGKGASLAGSLFDNPLLNTALTLGSIGLGAKGLLSGNNPTENIQSSASDAAKSMLQDTVSDKVADTISDKVTDTVVDKVKSKLLPDSTDVAKTVAKGGARSFLTGGLGVTGLAKSSLSSIAGMGTGSMLGAGMGVLGAGAAGYGVGTLLSKGIDKLSGREEEGAIGGWLYDKMHKNEGITTKDDTKNYVLSVLKNKMTPESYKLLNENPDNFRILKKSGVIVQDGVKWIIAEGKQDITDAEKSNIGLLDGKLNEVNKENTIVTTDNTNAISTNTNAMVTLSTNISKLFSKLGDTAKKTYDVAKNSASDTYNSAKTIASDVSDNIKTNIIPSINNTVTSVKDNAVSAIKSVGSLAVTGSAYAGTIPGMDGIFSSGDISVGGRTFGKYNVTPEVHDAIKKASEKYGIPYSYMMAMAAKESGFNPSIKAPTSSATGLYQFIKSTWQSMWNGTPPDITDPYANADAGARYALQNKNLLGTNDPAWLYLGHFLGGGGASKFYRAIQSNPNTLVTQVATPGQIKANRSIFLNKDGSPKTIADIYNWSKNSIGSLMSYAHIGGAVAGPSGSETPAMLKEGEIVLSNDKRFASIFTKNLVEILSEGSDKILNEYNGSFISHSNKLIDNEVSNRLYDSELVANNIALNNEKLVGDVSNGQNVTMTNITNVMTAMNNHLQNIGKTLNDNSGNNNGNNNEIKEIIMGRFGNV